MPKILLVEDDPLISEIYEKKFTESGFEFFSAASGEDALKLLKKEKIDIMLLDLVLPRTSGFDVLEAARSEGYDPDLKIIIFSNFSQKEDRDKALHLGANGFIAKAEFKPSELVTEIKRFLGQYQEQEKNEIRTNGQEKAADKNGKNILMIEDEEIFVDMFGEKLKQDGYAVTIARNGAWGVKEAIKGNFDLFVIDMVMPAMNGEEMVGKLKLEDNTKNTPILILSASVDEETQKRVEAMGISGFFIKTQITPSEISNKIAEILKT